MCSLHLHCMPKLWICEKIAMSLCMCKRAYLALLGLVWIVLREYWFFLSRSWPYHQCAKVISHLLHIHIHLCAVLDVVHNIVKCGMARHVFILCCVVLCCAALCTYLFPIGNCLFCFLVYWIWTPLCVTQCNKLAHLGGCWCFMCECECESAHFYFLIQWKKDILLSHLLCLLNE